MSQPTLPHTTTGTSASYISRAADVVSCAMVPNELWRLFFPVVQTVQSTRSDSDKPHAAIPITPKEETAILQRYQAAVTEYLTSGIADSNGAFITEAADFSAVAAWWPPGSHDPPTPTPPPSSSPPNHSNTNANNILSQFDRLITPIYTSKIWAKHGQSHWKLGILARDPRKAVAVPGAVRALLQPVIERARAAGHPIWLITSSEHAREIYLHFGWVDIDVVEVSGWRQWCLILEPGVTSGGREAGH